MFGLVRRERLRECEKLRVKEKLARIRLEGRVAELEQRQRDLEIELAGAGQVLNRLEAENVRLIEALAGRLPQAPEEPPAAAAPEPPARSLSGYEAVVRATQHRNELRPIPREPRVTEIFANASRGRRAAEAAKKAPPQAESTGA